MHEGLQAGVCVIGEYSDDIYNYIDNVYKDGNDSYDYIDDTYKDGDTYIDDIYKDGNNSYNYIDDIHKDGNDRYTGGRQSETSAL
mmetsp:Transcript_7824/g.23177  ORF Transcript_7824/g.23177 Transcript_7824/m.23177 type:complete len:85 (+) Transcript_7824:428-682(+)